MISKGKEQPKVDILCDHAIICCAVSFSHSCGFEMKTIWSLFWPTKDPAPVHHNYFLRLEWYMLKGCNASYNVLYVFLFGRFPFL